MGDYTDAVDAIVALVAGAALPVAGGGTLAATRDPAELVAGRPAVLVMVDTIAWGTLDGSGLPQVSALLVGVAADPAMSQLLDVVDEVAELIGANQARRATWTPPGADPLPCFQLTATE